MSKGLGLDYENWDRFRHELELANINADIALVMETADHFFHTVFEAGSEPKWSNIAQRDALIEFRKRLVALGCHIGVMCR